MWARFRDDIVAFWIGTEVELVEFHHWLNLLDQKLRFTMVYAILNKPIVALDLQLTAKTISLSPTSIANPQTHMHTYYPRLVIPPMCLEIFLKV